MRGCVRPHPRKGLHTFAGHTSRVAYGAGSSEDSSEARAQSSGTQQVSFLLHPSLGCTGMKQGQYILQGVLDRPLLQHLQDRERCSPHTRAHSFTHSPSTWVHAVTFTHSQTMLLISGSIMDSGTNSTVKVCVSLLSRLTKGHLRTQPGRNCVLYPVAVREHSTD